MRTLVLLLIFFLFLFSYLMHSMSFSYLHMISVFINLLINPTNIYPVPAMCQVLF